MTPPLPKTKQQEKVKMLFKFTKEKPSNTIIWEKINKELVTAIPGINLIASKVLWYVGFACYFTDVKKFNKPDQLLDFLGSKLNIASIDPYIDPYYLLLALVRKTPALSTHPLYEPFTTEEEFLVDIGKTKGVTQFIVSNQSIEKYIDFSKRNTTVTVHIASKTDITDYIFDTLVPEAFSIQKVYPIGTKFIVLPMFEYAQKEIPTVEPELSWDNLRAGSKLRLREDAHENIKFDRTAGNIYEVIEIDGVLILVSTDTGSSSYGSLDDRKRDFDLVEI